MNNASPHLKLGRGLVLGICLWLVLQGPSAMAARVLVTWDRNPEADIAGYRVHYGTSSRNYLTIVNAGNTTNAIIDNLTAGTTYYFALTAYNTSQLESDYSNELAHQVGGGTGSNAAPVILVFGNVSASKQTTTQANAFRIEDPDGASDVMRLEVQVSRGTLQVSSSVANGVTSNQITGNNSGSLQIQASLAAINNTLNAASGLSYRGYLNLVGPDTMTVTLTDGGKQGQFAPRSDNKNVQVQVTGDAWDTWRNLMFSVADLTDPAKEATVYGDNVDLEGDGLDNLMEFALGLDPEFSDSLNGKVDSGLVTTGGNSYTSLTFLRRKNQTLLQYVPEVSSDNATWNAGTAHLQLIQQQSVNTEFESVTYQDLTTIQPGAARFIRLTILRNTP